MRSEPVLNILVIEDDPAVQTLLTRILTREGFVVDCADDGAAGLDRLAIGRYDAVLLDLAMPKLSGTDVLLRLEQEGRTDVLPRIIVLTAASAKEISKLERVAVIRKPFDLHELMTMIRRITGQPTGTQAVAATTPRSALEAG